MQQEEDEQKVSEPGVLRIRAWIALYSLVGVLLLGIGIGWVLGRIGDGSEGVSGPGSAASAEGATELPGEKLAVISPGLAADADSLALAYELATRINSLESLLEAAKERELEPHALVQGAISQLSEDQLRGVLGPVVRLSPEELAEIEDVPAYASRLAEIAMEGLVDPANDEDGSGGRGIEVFFAPQLDRNDPESLAQVEFAQGPGRIYAIFGVGDYAGKKVMVKWYRSDGPELLLFRHYLLTPDDDFSWVWLGRPNGWSPGQYRVDVFSGDESVERMASGHFLVR